MKRYLPKESTFEFSGSMNFRFTTLDVVCVIAYDHSGYLDIREMFVASNRRGQMVPASERLMFEFQNANWDFLFDQAMDDARARAESYRDDIEYIGDMKCHERMDREAERSAA